MKLNLGCQIHYFDGWTNQDIVGDNSDIKVDLVCDAVKLPIKDESVDFIYAGHLVEHFYPDTLPLAIKEWRRVLKKGGKLVVITPDCGSIFKDYALGKLNIEHTWQQVYGRIYSYDAVNERHHLVFDDKELCKFIAGDETWKNVEWLNFNHPPEELVPFMDTHISRGAYQLGLILTK
jgi:ubiquinone/menaquinone biosynthesis C-methylase UbiE